MSNTTADLRQKIGTAGDLHSVVRTMKALAASSIVQYERAVGALTDYRRTVELGLGVCLRARLDGALVEEPPPTAPDKAIGVIIFGSDQGLVGQFNEVVVEHAMNAVRDMHGEPQVWAVGNRVHTCLEAEPVAHLGVFPVPTSVKGIAALVTQIQIQSETHRAKGGYSSLYVFHNQPKAGALYEPVTQRLLPLDAEWKKGLLKIPWPTKLPPEVMFSPGETLRALVREYLFISLFQACAESLASENASRLAAMQRASKNIDDLLETLRGALNHLRQGEIDEELFDVIAGFEAVGSENLKKQS